VERAIFVSWKFVVVEVRLNPYAKMMQPSSARRRACSQAFRPNSRSTVPPMRSLTTDLELTQVLTTRLVLASRLYAWLWRYEELR
jgi:hypothetical protein